MSEPVRPGQPQALDRFAPARQVADAVLYEGYVLYPYRASAAKNQMRWQFGVLAPRPFSEADGSERWSMRTDCVVEAGEQARVHVRVRWLQVQARTVEKAAGSEFEPVAALQLDEALWTTWDEAVDHELDLADLILDDLIDHGHEQRLELPGARTALMLRTQTGEVVGRIVHQRWPVAGRIRVEGAWCEGPYPLAKVTVSVENSTEWSAAAAPRHEVVRRSFVAVHTLLAVDDGRFVSMLDPPEFARAAVQSCENIGTFPVLVGDSGRNDCMLSSPIILYDHPEVAPESQGDMCDATEIDEILALRVLTLTDEEKREARGTDARAAAILDRCEFMPPELWDRLHGAVRSLRPVNDRFDEVLPWWEPAVDASFDPWSDTVWLGAVQIGKGSRVRLRPNRRADAHDMFLAGRTARVEGVFHDVDDQVHLAVAMEDDPAADQHQWHGRYLYFHPDEIEPLEVGS